MDISTVKLIPLMDTLRLENIDDAVYFSERYSGYISNSRLGLINPDQGGNPKKYFEGFAGNKIYSDALVFGSAVHELMLQPESFEIVNCVDRPTAKAGFIADIVYDKMKKQNVSEPTDDMLIEAAAEVDYYHGILDGDKLPNLHSKIDQYLQDRWKYEQSYNGEKELVYLDSKNRDRLNGCLTALQKNKKIMDLLHPEGLIETPISENERTILLDVRVETPDCEPVIIRLKSKLDNFTIDRETNTITVNDIKTTGKIVSLFNDAVENFHYSREMGMYSWLLSLCAEKFYGMKNPTIKSNFLVVSTIPDTREGTPKFYTKVVPMTRTLFLKGFNEFRDLTKQVAYYTVHPNEIEAECMTL